MSNLKNVAIQDDTHRLLRLHCADTGKTIQQVVESAMRKYLATIRKAVKK